MIVHEPDVLDVHPDVGEPSRRPVVAGVAAGLWALLVGVALVTCLVMLAWSVSPNSQGESAAAWRAAGNVWLGAHHVPLEIGGHPLTLLPLGALLLGLLLNRRGGRWAARLLPSPTPREAASIAAAATLVYGAGGMGLAWLSSSPGTGARLLPAFVWTGAVALVGTTWGMAREAGLLGWARCAGLGRGVADGGRRAGRGRRPARGGGRAGHREPGAPRGRRRAGVGRPRCRTRGRVRPHRARGAQPPHAGRLGDGRGGRAGLRIWDRPTG